MRILLFALVMGSATGYYGLRLFLKGIGKIKDKDIINGREKLLKLGGVFVMICSLIILLIGIAYWARSLSS